MTDTITASEPDPPTAEILTGSQKLKDEGQISINTSCDDVKPVNEISDQRKNPESHLETTKIPNFNVTSLNTGQFVPQITIEQQLHKSKRDLESMVLKYAKSERENLQNKNKVEELDKKLKRTIKDNDQLANRIKLLTNDKSHLTDNLNAKMAQLTVLEQKNSFLNNVQGLKLKEYEEKIQKLDNSNVDLLKQIGSYKSKEGELLDFSERLSMKHMMLQSELDEVLKKVPNYKEQYEVALEEMNSMLCQNEKLTKQIDSLSETLKKEQDCSESLRNEIEANKIEYRNNLDKLQNEIKVMRRKHQIAIKELFKEIKHLQAQLGEVAPASQSPLSNHLDCSK